MARNPGNFETGDQEIRHYDGPDIIVTSRYVVNRQARYAVRELRVIERVLVYRHPATKVAAICAAIELLIALPLAATYGSALLFCAGLTTAAGMGVAILSDGRRNPRWMALQAVYRGKQVTLYSTRNWRDFECVRWAVVRAVQNCRSPQL